MRENELKSYYEAYAETVYRLCYSFMKNASDAEDMLQETFLKLATQRKTFESSEHVKAWLIVTASNICRNALKHWWRHHEELTDETAGSKPQEEENDVLAAVLSLPYKYKLSVYMFYYEGYTAEEIAKLTGKPAGTVRSDLHTARKLLRDKLADFSDEV